MGLAFVVTVGSAGDTSGGKRCATEQEVTPEMFIRIDLLEYQCQQSSKTIIWYFGGLIQDISQVDVLLDDTVFCRSKSFYECWF